MENFLKKIEKELNPYEYLKDLTDVEYITEKYSDESIKACYSVNKNKLKHGFYVGLNHEGKYKLYCYYNEGVLNGPFIIYYEYPKIHIKMEYEKGIRKIFREYSRDSNLLYCEIPQYNKFGYVIENITFNFGGANSTNLF